jgi:hypothetical protein
MKFNINSYVEVKLTDVGRTHLQKEWENLCPGISYTPVKEVDGWSKWQLWILIESFGGPMYFGKEPPFETEIRILVDDDLSDKETLFVSYLLDQGASAIASRTCEDIIDDANTLFSPSEKDALEKAFHEWNGDPEEYVPGTFSNQGSVWARFYSDKIENLLSKKINIPVDSLHDALKSQESIDLILKTKAKRAKAYYLDRIELLERELSYTRKKLEEKQ